jgi:hypothetical protein
MSRREFLFRRRDRRKLWESSTSSGSDNEAQVAAPNPELVDLCHSPEPSAPIDSTASGLSASLPLLLPPGPTVWPAPETSGVFVAFVPRTLQPDSRRHSILPAFPTSFYNDRPPLLLANVSSQWQMSQTDRWTSQLHVSF